MHGPPVTALDLIIGVPLGLGYTAYLKQNPEALQRIKLGQIVLAEHAGGEWGSYNNGWVFFPSGKYTEVKLSIRRSHLGLITSESVLVEDRKLPWVTTPPGGGGDLWVEHGIPPLASPR